MRQGVGLWIEGTNDAQAMQLLHRTVTLFDQEHRPIPRLLIDLAPLYNRMHQPEARFAYFFRKLAYYRLHGANENAAACYLVLGSSYRHQGDFNHAISSYLHAADLFKAFDRMLYVNELMVAGSAYEEWGNLDKAQEYLSLAMQLENRYKLEGLRRFYTLNALAKLTLRQHRLPQGLHYADLSLLAARRDPLDRFPHTAYGLVQKSAVLVELGRTQEALPLLRRAQSLSDSLALTISGRPGEFMLDQTWAQYYIAIGQYHRAEQHWLLAYQKANEVKFNVLRPKLLRQIIHFYDEQKQLTQVQRYTHAYLALADSMNTVQNAFNIAQYEGERTEQAQNEKIEGLRHAHALQTLRLRQRNFLLAISLGVVTLISGLGVVLYYQLRTNKRTLAQLRQAQNQLVAAEKWAFVGEMSAGIAHELQNPLNFMKRFAEVSTKMLDDMQHPRKSDGHTDELEQEIVAGLKQNLQEISQHGLRASSIIKDMLDHSRSGTNRRQPNDLNALIADQLELAYKGLQAQDAAFHATLTLDLAPDLAPVSLVPQDMGRVLLNLLTNSFHAVQQRGQTAAADYSPTVWITTKQLAQQIEIRIRDNGTGMSEEVKQQAFQAFFTTKPAGVGTGLGLSLSHDIITKGHGGTINIKTEEGHYTEFIITLPA
ncbi:ATP-binding protein [Hymenobacter sp. GOD-10R]|uniref:tetratricopeptide repeat-containing sensor histidine kinase n=1 Tax=Hymenobacter sp. GOD-10R TaxID=3093922 RepID=UPI002D789441|nr:ATP-binding protein [Hymenobacter sp. GOD-10R]WRQ30990.1 ATP-binding protein [Hymenobacter sp. GOD-10R]